MTVSVKDLLRRFVLPVGIVVGGFGLAAVIIATGPSIEPLPPPSNAPLVRTWQADSQPVQMTTVTHGTVLPRTESDLVPEVSGRVVEISPSLVSGGFFTEGDLLLAIDPLDYEVALEQARAAIASARSELDNAQRSHERQLDLAKRQSTSQAQIDDAANRLQFAQASLREAEARLSKAERDLKRTRILAPFDGRVRSERVDIGQFVNRGTAIASLYATDVAEVRLPVNDEELAFLDLPLAGAAIGTLPKVILRAEFGGSQHTWEGQIVRTEGELDPQTRMINVIAQVDAPYQVEGDRPPLAVGLFVEAEIIGRELDEVFVLPRSAIQLGNQVYVINSDNRIEFRDVDITRTVEEDVYVTGGIRKGETISISTISNAVEGMSVRPVVGNEGLAAS